MRRGAHGCAAGGGPDSRLAGILDQTLGLPSGVVKKLTREGLGFTRTLVGKIFAPYSIPDHEACMRGFVSWTASVAGIEQSHFLRDRGKVDDAV